MISLGLSGKTGDSRIMLGESLAARPQAGSTQLLDIAEVVAMAL